MQFLLVLPALIPFAMIVFVSVTGCGDPPPAHRFPASWGESVVDVLDATVTFVSEVS